MNLNLTEQSEFEPIEIIVSSIQQQLGGSIGDNTILWYLRAGVMMEIGPEWWNSSVVTYNPFESWLIHYIAPSIFSVKKSELIHFLLNFIFYFLYEGPVLCDK